MNQDGLEPLTQLLRASDSDNRSANLGNGSITLILCRPKSDTHLHATIQLPSSYQEACVKALTTFGTYIPSNVKSGEISLRRVIRRKDGEYVWSIIPEVDWNAVLERHGEEIGVFLPNAYPGVIPYQKARPTKKLVSFQFWDREIKENKTEVVAAVRSFGECLDFINEESPEEGFCDLSDLYYDQRMIGTRAEREDYRNRIETPKWSRLDHSALFDILIELHPEPLVIRVDSLNL